MFKKQVVLVAGFDYEFNGLDFNKLCRHRAKRLFAANPKDQLRVTLFDIGAGTVTQNEINAKKQRNWKTLSKFTPVSKSNYSKVVAGHENAFDQNQSGIMSITDVYAFIQKIGAGKEAGTLKELSVFSHGWMGGPVLVNSFDGTASGSSQRDANDKDARSDKDFVAPTMPSAALANFRKAFDTSAIVWTWGCSFAKAYNMILHTLFNTSQYKQIPRGKVKPADMFDLEFTEDLGKSDGKERFDEIRGMLKGGKLQAGSPRSYQVSVSFQTILDLYRSDLRDTYSAKIASASKRTTYGALLGTYADIEQGPQDFLMLIPRKVPPYADDFTRVVNFYKHYLGIAIDPEDRGYGTF
ncbi:hypothetical protein [Ralstonia sp. UBA689]|uniref:hypothetical protein n=1 Tax=Ralstonia sp. UBA689 TaxID=1947373 RepID=UPI0025E0FE8C|nr:hypothetical protein [Ralstonia sp. UBA689]